MRQPLVPGWWRIKPLIGMVHLMPLPGSPGWAGSMQRVLDAAVRDAEALAQGGIDGILVENFGDTPFFPDVVPAATIAALTSAVLEVRRSTALPIGINVLRNDAAAALGICAATGATFIRVNVHAGAMLTDQGWITGRAHETLRLRAQLGSDAAILADVLVKHATPLPGLDIADAARDTWQRGRADALIVTGPATGTPARTADIRDVKAAVPDALVLVGSGVDLENAATLLELADGAIVGSALKADGRTGSPVSAERVRRLVDVAAAFRV